MAVKKTVLVVCHESPGKFSGGGAETKAKLALLESADIDYIAVDWSWEVSEGARLRSPRGIALRKAGLRDAPWAHLLMPSPLATRHLTRSRMVEIAQLVRQSRPGNCISAVICDGLHGIVLARHLAQDFACRLIYRSHNVESAHRAIQIRLNFRRAPLAAFNAWKFLKWDAMARKVADVTAEIAVEDLAWRPGLVPNKRRLVHPIVLVGPEVRQVEYKYDLAFVGSLDNEINYEGIDWFVQNIMPRYRQLNLAIYGAASSQAVAALRRRLNFVTIHPNFETFKDVLSSTAVVINPVRRSTGVNIKTFESLANGAVVAASAPGSRGFGRPGRPEGLYEIEKADLHLLVQQTRREGAAAVCARRTAFSRNILGPARQAYLEMVAI